jgi:hypothetical protein
MRKTALVAILISALLVPVSAQGATAKAGAKCTKLKSTQTVSGKKFTCIKSGKKLVWDKGVKVPVKPTPKPTSTPTAKPTPTPTPTPISTPTAEPTPTPPPVVVKKSQEIDFPALKDIRITEKKLALPKAMTSGGLSVTYSAIGTCAFDAASNSVLLNSVGQCSIMASQAGDANYLPATAITRTFAIVKAPQEINFTATEDVFFTTETLSPDPAEELTTAGLKVTYSTSGECSYDAVSNTISLKSAGKCSITASQAGDANYLPATPITHSFEIKKIAQTIVVDEFEDQDLLETKALTINFTKVEGAPEVVMTSSTEDICTTEGNDVSFLAEGDCELTFTNEGNDIYEAASTVTRTIKLFYSAIPGSEASPAEIGTVVVKNGISVSLDAINEEVSDAICEADSANEACLDEDGVGVFDAESESRYVEIIFTITNESQEVWIASNIGFKVDDENIYLNTLVYGIDSLDLLELEPGDSITGSYFVLLPNEVDSNESLIYYGNDTEDGVFYFKAS